MAEIYEARQTACDPHIVRFVSTVLVIEIIFVLVGWMFL